MGRKKCSNTVRWNNKKPRQTLNQSFKHPHHLSCGTFHLLSSIFSLPERSAKCWKWKNLCVESTCTAYCWVSVYCFVFWFFRGKISSFLSSSSFSATEKIEKFLKSVMGHDFFSHTNTPAAKMGNANLK